MSTGTIATCVLGFERVFAHLIAEEIPASGPDPPSSTKLSLITGKSKSEKNFRISTIYS